MSESPELLPVTEKKSSCGCHEHSDERLTLDARAIPHRLRHAAVIGAASSLNPGEGFDLVAPPRAHPRCWPRSTSCPSPSSTPCWSSPRASRASRSCAPPDSRPRSTPAGLKRPTDMLDP